MFKAFENFRFQFPVDRADHPHRNSRGQGMIEYLIIVALMGVATIAIVRVMGEVVSQRFASVTDALQGKTLPARSIPIPTTYYGRKSMANFAKGVGDHAGGKEAGAANSGDDE